jgi:hypothetical protein
MQALAAGSLRQFVSIHLSKNRPLNPAQRRFKSFLARHEHAASALGVIFAGWRANRPVLSGVAALSITLHAPVHREARGYRRAPP